MGSRSESLAGEATFAKKPGACGTVSKGYPSQCKRFVLCGCVEAFIQQ